MPDSWIDRDELASLAGELSRKKRRLSNRGVGPSQARNRPQGRAGTEPQKAPRSVESANLPQLEAAEVEQGDALAEPLPEAEAADTLTEPLPEAEAVDAPVEPLPEAKAADTLTESLPEAEAADTLTKPLPEAEAVDTLTEPPTESSLEAEPPDPFLGGFCETTILGGNPSPKDLEEQLQAMPLESLAPPESQPAEADFPPEEEGEDLFERDLLERDFERAEAREGVLTNLSIAEPDPEAVRNRAPLFLREAESLLEGVGNLPSEADDAVALRSLAAARARADQGGLLKEVLAGQGEVRLPADSVSGPVASSPLPVEPSGPNPLAPELPPLESLFEVDTPDGSVLAESGPEGQAAELSFEAPTTTGAEPSSEPFDEPLAYESAEESLPWRLAQFAFAFASGTGSRNVCIVDEAGYPLHEDNPELRLRSRGAELAFFPDPRLTGGSELSAAQAFLAGRWHGIIRGAAPCCHLFLRFDREDPLETAEMENWSRHLVETLA